MRLAHATLQHHKRWAPHQSLEHLPLSLSLSRCSSELATTRCAIAALESFRGNLSQQLFASPRNLHIPALIPQTKCLQWAHIRVCQGSDLAKKTFGNRESTTGIQTPFRAAWSATFYLKFLPLLVHRCKHFLFIPFPVTLPYPLWNPVTGLIPPTEAQHSFVWIRTKVKGTRKLHKNWFLIF